MITTVTLNAAVDKFYLVENMMPDTVMRVREVYNTAGGKGLNVSKVAAIAGESVTATGFLGGFNGRYVASLLESAGINARFAETNAETRSCINIRSLATGKHTEYLEPGAEVTGDELEEFMRIFRDILPISDILTISGSVPEGTPTSFYGDVIRLCKDAGRPVILDTSGECLKEGVKAKPTMIKPNVDEIGQMLGEEIHSPEQVISAAKKLYKDGIEYMAVSLGKDGAILVCGEGVFKAEIPQIAAVNTVGCGDSMVAGFAVSMRRGYNAVEMLRFATAMASANALEMQTGCVKKEKLEMLLTAVQITKI